MALSLASCLSRLGIPLQRYICFRPYVLPVVVGLCLGITIHMMVVPFLEENCDASLAYKMGHASQQNAHENNNERKLTENSLDDEDLTARIVKPNNTGQKVVNRKIVRPRFISSELGLREKLFVAIFSSAGSLDTFAVAVDKTLSQHVTKVVFFTNKKPSNTPAGLPVIRFGEIHSELLPIHILRYILEHHADGFDYYMFATDRTYLRAQRITEMVEKISVSEDVHMGVTGLENYCSLEGGLIISQSVMSKVLSNLDWCTKNTHATNPSITLGRCIVESSQIQCTSKGGDKVFTHFQLDDFDYDDDIEKLKEIPEFNKSLSFFPMPDDISHYKIHRYFCYVELNQTQQEIDKAKEDIIDLSQYSPGGRDSLTWPIGAPEPHKPTNRFGVIPWTYFTETHMYLDNELTNIQELAGADKLDIQDIMQTAIEKLERKFQNRYKYQRLVNGYRRLDPTRGMEYNLDLMLKDTSDNNHDILRRVHLLRPLGQAEIVNMPYVTENVMVHIVIPVRPDEVSMFDMFLDGYAKGCLETNDNSRLIIAFIYPNGIGLGKGRDPYVRAKALMHEYGKRHNTGNKLSWKAISSNSTYINDIAVVDSVMSNFKSDSLLLMGKINMEVSMDTAINYLNRVRMNTIKGYQVYFPIGFWQYKPSLIYTKKPYPSSVEVGQRLGRYDTESFEHFSFYTADYKVARKLLTPNVASLGDVFSMFINYKKFHVFRAAEPSLKLRWTSLSCNPEIPGKQYQMCLTRRAEGLASQQHLALLLFEDRHEVIKQQNIEPALPEVPVPNKVKK